MLKRIVAITMAVALVYIAPLSYAGATDTENEPTDYESSDVEAVDCEPQLPDEYNQTETEPGQNTEPQPDDDYNPPESGQEQEEEPDSKHESDFEQEPEEAENHNPVLNVLIPLSLDFTLDPFEINGRGSVYSDTFKIENHSDFDVVITFSDISVTFANQTDFLPLPRPFNDGAHEYLKAIYLLLDFGRADTPPVIATSPYAAGLSVAVPLSEPGAGPSTCALSISGNLNPNPAQSWVSGDVRINVKYTIEAVIAQDEEELDDEEEPDDKEAELDIEEAENEEEPEDDEDGLDIEEPENDESDDNEPGENSDETPGNEQYENQGAESNTENPAAKPDDESDDDEPDEEDDEPDEEDDEEYPDDEEKPDGEKEPQPD
jgi:hypothetical protein